MDGEGLKKHDTACALIVKARGVLHAARDALGFSHVRYAPCADLAPFVEHYWTVEWDLEEPCVRETLPHPVVHLVAEDDEATIGGPSTRRWTRTFPAGRGRVFAVKFLPGGFRPFVREPVRALADRVIAIERVFGESARGLAGEVFATPRHDVAIGAFELFLRARRPQPSDAVFLSTRIAQRIATDRAMTRIEQVAKEFSLTPRSLQRLFREFIGVSPKAVVQRFRLHELVERIDSNAAIDWTATALDLGYADQAHLIRDFRKIVGRSPTEYARGLRSESERLGGREGGRDRMSAHPAP